MIRQLAALTLQRAVGSHVGTYYREFLALRTLSPYEATALHAARLRDILRYAATNSPYYTQRVRLGRTPSLQDFPIMTKTALSGSFRELLAPTVLRAYDGGRQMGRGYSWTLVHTGGTTGRPTTVVHDRETRDRGRAARLFSQYLCGFPFGVPYFRLWGSMRDINEMRDSLGQRVLRELAGEVLLNAFRMRPENMARYIETMNRSAIGYLMAYVDAAVALAEFARAQNLHVRGLNAIMACAGTVTPDARSVLSGTFQARVHNKYGSRECGDVACECEVGSMHVYTNNVALEVIGPDEAPVTTGQRGRILITLLHSRAFPLIRYDIGDIGAWRDGDCRCGLPLPVFDTVEGRSVEFLRSVDGAQVSPVYIRHLIGVVHNPGFLERFQLVQRGHDDFLLRLEVPHQVDDARYIDFERVVRRDLLAVLGLPARLLVERVQSIENGESEKFMYTVNQTAPPV